jgi:hypothetical protein
VTDDDDGLGQRTDPIWKVEIDRNRPRLDSITGSTASATISMRHRVRATGPVL